MTTMRHVLSFSRSDYEWHSTDLATYAGVSMNALNNGDTGRQFFFFAFVAGLKSACS